jgi:hypothetical protein
MIMLDDNLFIREDRKTGGIVYINSVGKGKLFGNPVEQAVANAIETGDPNYLNAIPENTPGYVVGATFEEAGRKIGVDLGNYYTTFINLISAGWMWFAGAKYPGSYTNNHTPSSLASDALGDPDCTGCGFSRNPKSPGSVLMPNGSPVGREGTDPDIRIVGDTNELMNIYDDLTVNAVENTASTYDGIMFDVAGGSVGVRYSRNYGLTLDINIEGIPFGKIHLPK